MKESYASLLKQIKFISSLSAVYNINIALRCQNVSVGHLSQLLLLSFIY